MGAYIGIIGISLFVLILAIYSMNEKKPTAEYGEKVNQWRLVDYSLMVNPIGMQNKFITIPLDSITKCTTYKTCICIETNSGDKYRLNAYLKQDAEVKCNEIKQRIKEFNEKEVVSN